MPSPATPPPGYSTRPVTLDDAVVLAELMAASSQSAIGEDDVTVDEVRAELGRPTLDLSQDTWLVFDDDGRLVAYGEAEDEDPELAMVDLYLRPGMAEEPTVGAWLLEQCLARADEFLRESGRSGVPVDAGCYRQETRIADLLRSAGLGHVRSYWRMAIELDDDHLRAPAPPPGVTIRALDVDDRADAELAHRLVSESFRGHWGEVEQTFERFWEQRRRGARFDPTQWWVAEVDGDPAGLVTGDDRRDHENEGWVTILGVLETYRGRGLGKLLLRQAFAEHHRRGRTRTLLTVDSENTTGATGLYESVGMTPVVTIDVYRLSGPRE